MNWIDYRQVKPFSFFKRTTKNFPEENIVQLSKAESSILEEAALLIKQNPYKKEEVEAFIAESKGLVQHFSNRMITAVCASLNQFGSVLITGLPIEPNPPATPVKCGSIAPDYKNLFVNEALLIAIGNLTKAELFNYRQEGQGSAPLIDNVVPVAALKSLKGGGGYENNFPFHTESAWHRKRPDYLILYGVREDSQAQTLVFSLKQLISDNYPLNGLTDKERFRLKAPELYLRMQQEGLPLGTNTYASLPPVEIQSRGYKMNINFNGTDCIDLETVEILSKFEEYIESRAVATVVSPGSALILNNEITCHTRTGYAPKFNGEDRWFLRTYFKRELWVKENYFLNGKRDVFTNTVYYELLNKGWITEDGQLSKNFVKFIQDPCELNNLDSDEMRLASIAFQMTPVKGHHII